MACYGMGFISNWVGLFYFILSHFMSMYVTQIPGGWFVDRFGAKSAILTSQLFLSILSLVNPIAANLGPEYMFVARLLQGVANVRKEPVVIEYHIVV